MVHHEHALAHEHRVGLVHLLEHPPLVLREVGLDAVEEERRLVEQVVLHPPIDEAAHRRKRRGEGGVVDGLLEVRDGPEAQAALTLR